MSVFPCYTQRQGGGGKGGLGGWVGRKPRKKSLKTARQQEPRSKPKTELKALINKNLSHKFGDSQE